jgi:hypothetical protein
MRSRTLIIGGAVVMTLSFVSCVAPKPLPNPNPSAPASGTFLETFNGAPSTPTPWTSPRWDITVHTRGRAVPELDYSRLDEPMTAAHAHDCTFPGGHGITLYEQTVYQCRDHVMTAINGADYALIYLTPNQMVDFSQGEAVIKFDMSTLRTSLRDWIDVWISPFEDNVQLALDIGPDLQGPPRRGIQIKMENFGRTGFFAQVYNGFNGTRLPGRNVAYETFLVPDGARRDTFELRISKTHLRFGMPQYNQWWVDTNMPALNWTTGVVQFGHHSYNPTKDDATANAQANSWHWDNISISPARPFTMIKANRRSVNADRPGAVTLAQPAPDGAFLRFAGIGEALQVRFGSGPWVPAVLKPSGFCCTTEHFKSYWMPIPKGTQQVTFSGSPHSGNWPWEVRDISVWRSS